MRWRQKLAGFLPSDATQYRYPHTENPRSNKIALFQPPQECTESKSPPLLAKVSFITKPVSGPLRLHYNENSLHASDEDSASRPACTNGISTFSRNCYRFLTWRNTRTAQLMERALEMQRRLCSGRKRNANEAATGNSPSLAHQAVLLFIVHDRTHTRSSAALPNSSHSRFRRWRAHGSLNMCGIMPSETISHVFSPTNYEVLAVRLSVRLQF